MSLYSLFLYNKKSYDKKLIITNETLHYDKHIHQIKNISTLNVKNGKNHYPAHLIYMLITIIVFPLIINLLINENKHDNINILILIEISLILLFIIGNIVYVINKDESSLILTLNSGEQYPILVKKKEVVDFVKLSIQQKIERKTTNIIEIKLLDGNYTSTNMFGTMSNHVI